MSIYQFTEGHQYLDSIGIPRLADYDDNVIIERHDLTKEEVISEMEWRDDGVYMKHQGEYRRGFLYNRDYLVDVHGMPRWHIAKCKTIQKFENWGTLHKAYYWSNAPKVLVTQRGTDEKYPDEILQLCGNCWNLINADIEKYAQTNSEFQSAEKIIKPATTTDIHGRPMNWPAISRRYREKMNYTCEKCGFGGADLKKTRDRRYIDADHIIAQELMNTADSNLQCLCVLCHSFKDGVHEAHLARPHVRLRLAGFISDYADVLSRKNATLLKRFRLNYSD